MTGNKKSPAPNAGLGKCSKCNKLPNEKKLAVTCDSCRSVVCGDCHGLSPTEVRVFELKTVARVVTFLCGDCKAAMTQLPLIMKKLEELTAEVQQLRLRQSMLATESAIQEISERANRANNVIIYNIEESPSNDSDERKEHDKKECIKVIDSVTNKIECSRVKVFRLGAPRADPKDGPRPIKVILNSKRDAVELLRNRSKLAKPSSVVADLTPMQREYMKHLREELDKRITNGETDITIKYVRGHPQIVKKPKNH